MLHDSRTCAPYGIRLIFECTMMRDLVRCRCAARGMRVYRVWRDDTYLRDMLHLLQELQASEQSWQDKPTH